MMMMMMMMMMMTEAHDADEDLQFCHPVGQIFSGQIRPIMPGLIYERVECVIEEGDLDAYIK